jgi:WD40 repeat protein
MRYCVIVLSLVSLAGFCIAPAAEQSAAGQAAGSGGQRSEKYTEPLPAEAIRRLGTLRLRHGYGIEGVQFSQDGKRLIAFDLLGISLWNVSTGIGVGRLQGPKDDWGGNRSLALSPDGKTLCVTDGNALVFWDIPSQTMRSSIYPPLLGRIRLLGYGKDNKTLAFLVRKTSLVRPQEQFPVSYVVWDIANRAIINQWSLEAALSLDYPIAYSADGQWLAAYHDKRVSVWQTTSGKRIHHFAVSPSSGVRGAVAAFSAHTHLLAYASRDGIYIWDLSQQRYVQILKGTKAVAVVPRRAPIRCLAFSSDDSLLAAGDGAGNIQVWNLNSGGLLYQIHAHDSVQGLTFSPDSKLLVSWGLEDHTIGLWNALSGQPCCLQPGHQAPITALALLADDRLLSASRSSVVLLWSLKGEVERQWSLEKIEKELSGGQLTSPIREVLSLVLVQRGNKVVTAANNGLVVIWDLYTGKKVFSFLSLLGPVRCLEATPGEKGLIIGTGLGVLAEIEWTSLEQAALLSPQGIPVVADAAVLEQLAVAAKQENTTLQRWGLGQRVPTRWLIKGHEAGVCSLALSADGSYLISRSIDNTIRVWRRGQDIKLIHHLAAFNNSISLMTQVKVSPDGHLFASSAQDTVRLWDIRSGQVKRFWKTPHIQSFAFSQDGDFLAGGLHLWSDHYLGYAHRSGGMYFERPRGCRDEPSLFLGRSLFIFWRR